MTEENLKLGSRKLQAINELKLFRKKLDANNSILKYEDAELTAPRGSDLYKLLMDYLNKKIDELEKDFATFDVAVETGTDTEEE